MFSVRTTFVGTLIVLAILVWYWFAFFIDGFQSEEAVQFLASDHGHLFIAGMVLLFILLFLKQFIELKLLVEMIPAWSVIVNRKSGEIIQVIPKKKLIWKSVFRTSYVITFTYEAKRSVGGRLHQTLFYGCNSEVRHELPVSDFNEYPPKLKALIEEIIKFLR